MTKVLINGCSHTRACIPDAEPEEHHKAAWPEILKTLGNYDMKNLATDGKCNRTMVEETIRYIIHRPEWDHVVIALTDWERLNLFRAAWSGKQFHPNDIESQLPARLGSFHVKIPALSSKKDMRVFRTEGTGQKPVEIGDLTYRYDIIQVGTMLNCLKRLCEEKGITLHILNYFGTRGNETDPVFDNIRDDFIIDNFYTGLYNHLLWSFETPDTYHFEKIAHISIAGYAHDHIEYRDKPTIREESFDDRNRVYDYGQKCYILEDVI